MALPANAPLLFARIGASNGVHATFFQPTRSGRVFDVPVTVGLRPGYIYRLQLTGLPLLPGVSLYPSLEVRGTVAISPGINPANFPVPVFFSEEDFQKALKGSLITKVVYLEQPENALAAASSLERPIETEVPLGQDPLVEARMRGRPVLIIRFGEREADPMELATQSIGGTILLPGETVLGPPQSPPWLPWACWMVYDPIAGPRPSTAECIGDGGDVGNRVGLGPDGKLYGLDPTDTVAEYSDSKGLRHLSISNRVCIYAPRFNVLRSEAVPSGYSLYASLSRTKSFEEGLLLQTRQGSRATAQAEELAAIKTRQKTSGAESSQGTVPIDQFLGLAIAQGRIKGMNIVGTCRQERELPPDRPLVIQKWADTHAARIGDIVTFHLKYTNRGGRPITDVAVSDSLSPRLEYLPESAQSDMETIFTMQTNEAGSLILRWEVGGSLLPGQSGLLTFKARVR